MSGAVCRCGAHWVGRRIEHCPSCHETFTGTRPGDLHRVGPHWPPGVRRCLTPEEMLAKGMVQNVRGQWQCGSAGRKGGVARRWSMLGAAQNDAQAEGVLGEGPGSAGPSDPRNGGEGA